MASARTPRSTLGATPERLKQAAAACVERHGVEKATVEDIAHDAGVSRAVIYRYFRGREHLLMAVLHDRSNALRDRACRFMADQPTFGDALVEGLLFLAEHGRRDPVMRHLVEADGTLYAQRLIRLSGAGRKAAAEFWASVFDRAQRRGEFASDTDRDAAYEWLALAVG